MELEIDRNEVYEKILEENGSVIYLVDVETYELVYMTRGTLQLFGRPVEDTSYIGQKCYEVLQGRTAPCEFCNNEKLKKDEFVCWEHYNPLLNRYFSIRDKMILMAGRKLRMEMADDISQIILEKQRLQNDLSAEKSLMLCIQNLTAVESHDQSIHELLEKVCDLYQGERGYIFQFDFERQTGSNTYEWCKEGVQPEIANLQNIPLGQMQSWIDIFQKGGGVRIDDLQTERAHDSFEYQLLAPQKINSLAAVPLLKGEQIIGFIGVDNPERKPEDLFLMETIAQFVSNDIEKRRILKELERTSHVDLLAKVYNRNRYMTDVKKLCSERTLPIGVVFLDLDNLKEINDTYGHDYGDTLIKHAASILYSFFPDEVYRIGGDEFIVLCKEIPREEFDNRVKRLRKQFEEEQVRISMGANWRLGGENLKESILYVDQLMYQDKAHGKLQRGRHHE